MSAIVYSIFILLFAGFVSDGNGLSFFAAALGIVVAEWTLRSGAHTSDRRFLILDPDTLDAQSLKEAFHQILDDVRNAQRPIHLRLATLTRHLRFCPQLQFNRDGEIEIVGCRKKEVVKLPNIWIADHPLPLQLSTAHSTSLTFTPSHGDRVRVEADTLAVLSGRERLLLGGLLATTAFLGFHGLFSALLAFTLTRLCPK